MYNIFVLEFNSKT